MMDIILSNHMTFTISIKMACSSASAAGTADMSSGISDSEVDQNQVIESEVCNEVYT